jgi:predicted pyridoxine 5'-phosphate oxidase superfamily flavin-nucleotide-binding protein
MYGPSSRGLQDRFDTRRLADRLAEVKVHRSFTPDDRAFIERLDMFFLATVDDEGRPTCSYKGGDPGFVRVLDERTLAFPSYDGNGMFLSLGNLAATEHVGLLFIDFQESQRLRVDGRARLAFEHPLLERHPEAQLVVEVEADRIYPNCGRYIHHYALVERSRFVPREGSKTPVAAWKRAAWATDVLPRAPRPLVGGCDAATAERSTHYGPEAAPIDAPWFEPTSSDAADAAALVRACVDAEKRALLLDVDRIPAAFFDLRSGFAGELLRQLGRYGIRLAVVVPDLAARSPALQAFARKKNRGRRVRVVLTRQEAVEWLVT